MDNQMDSLVKTLLDGDQIHAISEARKLREMGIEDERIVTDGIVPAMEQLDSKCTIENFNLLEIMLVGRAVMGVMKELYPSGAAPTCTRGTVVIASPEGDVHDLGKNVLKAVLTAKAYHVVDCGKDCPMDKLIRYSAAGRGDCGRCQRPDDQPDPTGTADPGQDERTRARQCQSNCRRSSIEAGLRGESQRRFRSRDRLRRRTVS